jgi:Xaa-Pro dipeptidase
MTAQSAYKTGFTVHHVKTHEILENRDLWKETLASMVDGIRVLGILRNTMTCSKEAYWKRICKNDCEIKDVSDAVIKTASVKDTKEIEDLRLACSISARVVDEIPGMIEEGISERDLARRIDDRMHDLGAEGTTFPTIVGFGPDSSLPHAVPGWRKLSPGDIILVDFGAVIDGTGADITRTYVFKKAHPLVKKMYSTVFRAQKTAYEMIRKGNDAEEIRTMVSLVFAQKQFGPLIHSIGRILGLVEGPFVNIPGAAVTVEPGIYEPGWGGIRIEDDIIIKDVGDIEILTGSASEEITVLS